MCGRFTLTRSGPELATLFDLASAPDLPARYNIAPTQPVAVVRLDRQGQREFTVMRWGLIPSWAKDISIGARMINARAETVAEKPSFRAAFKRRRCLIPSTGFYEWQKSAGRKQPFFIGVRDQETFAMAGLWEFWQGADGSELETCTILTTSANDLVAPLHDRMPVILDPLDFGSWLAPDARPDLLMHLLRPFDAGAMITYPVSPLVNSPANDSPACLEPLS